MNHLFYLKYPVCNSKTEMYVSAVGIAVLTYLFLIIFQPFGTYNFVHTNKYLLLAPYSIIAFITFLSGDFIVSKFFNKWTLSKEIFKITTLLFVCSFLNYVYSKFFINEDEFSFRALIYMAMFTFALGIPVCTIWFLGRYRFPKKITEIHSKEINKKVTGTFKSEIIITPDTGGVLNLSKNEFLYAQSKGNYSTLYFLENGKVQKRLIRVSLKKLEEQICDETILRTHRSYIIHTPKAVYKKGNAQGYKIKINHVDDLIPVSRKYVDKILNLL